ncbi:MAG: hypothetical protein JWR34_5767 [Mycobacterium sp.]|nr:hypothetical protein [Mycobacterium sp.]
MGVQDTTDRFAYLFEPIDAEPTAEDHAAESVPHRRRWWPVPIVAVMVGLAGAVVVIQSWPGPRDVAPDPSGSTTHVVPNPIVTTIPVVGAAPEFVAPPEVTANVMDPVPVSVTPPPQPQPSAPPSPSSRPETGQAPSPTLRAPISVSPEPRPAFPNQHLPDNDNNNDGGRGGLLGRLGL